jgi:lipoprotein-releasing system permease protein
MKTELFLARKIRKTKGKTFSSSVITIGIASVAIGVAAVIISFSVLLGFKNTIKDKLFSMSAHLQLSKITRNQTFEEAPFANNSQIKNLFLNNNKIAEINAIALKSAILKSEEEISGVVLKGVDREYHWERFRESIIEGRTIEFDSSEYSKEIIISRVQQKLLKLNVGDDLLIYFIQNPPRARKVKVVGIYDTGIEDIDRNYSILDINLIRRINGWNDDDIGHAEIFLKNVSDLDTVVPELYENLPQDLQLTKITRMMPQFFDWFNLLDRNIIIVIFLIAMVAGFNMVSVLLIMIMERTPMVGLLKALGSSNGLIQRIFISNAVLIIVKGLVIGNVVALGFCFLQEQFRIIPLDPENYYMSYVPVSWHWSLFFLINLVAVLIITLIVTLPTLAIAKISPEKALKYKK